MSIDRYSDLIFAHRSDARAAASVTLAGVIAVLIGAVYMALGPRLPDTPARSGLANGDANTVRIVGTAPARNGACGDQVWPNIERGCLVRTDANAAAAPEKPAAKVAAQDPKQDDEKLTPLTATGATVVGGVTPPDAINNVQKEVQKDVSVTRPASVQPETVGRTTRADGTSDVADNDAGEPARRRRIHLRFPFHGHIGPFRF